MTETDTDLARLRELYEAIKALTNDGRGYRRGEPGKALLAKLKPLYAEADEIELRLAGAED
jgi:hypothetical protein